MAANTEFRRSAIATILAALALPAQATSIACHLIYGGESRVVEAVPVTDPYTVPTVSLGSYFLFRIVFRDQPADLAGIKLTAYADRDAGPTIIHQATYPYPPPSAAVNGFTGLNFIYEPVRDGELQYWCELKGRP